MPTPTGPACPVINFALRGVSVPVPMSVWAGACTFASTAYVFLPPIVLTVLLQIEVGSACSSKVIAFEGVLG